MKQRKQPAQKPAAESESGRQRSLVQEAREHRRDDQGCRELRVGGNAQEQCRHGQPDRTGSCEARAPIPGETERRHKDERPAEGAQKRLRHEDAGQPC